MLGLSRTKETGKAKVVTITLARHGFTHTDSNGRSTSRYDVVLDVYPGVGSPFRAETHHQFSPIRLPAAGEELAVKFNPDKQTVEIDLSGDARYNPKIFRKENDRRFKEDHDRVMREAPGTPFAPEPDASKVIGHEAGESARKYGADGSVNS